MPYSDSAIFAAVGNGILHELRPYIDLFETKTPAVFLPFAVSLGIFGDLSALFWLQGLVIVAMPVLIVLPMRPRRGMFANLAAKIVAITVTLYVAQESGRLLPESFGVFFTLLFLGMFHRYQERQWAWHIWAALTVLMLLAAAMKEPFALVIMGCVFLLARRWLDIVRLLLLSSSAVLLWSLLILAVPILRGYFTVYLPHMLGFHLIHPYGTIGESIWMRTVDLPRIWLSLQNVPFLAWVAALLWSGAERCLHLSSSTGRHELDGSRWASGSLAAG